MLARSSPTGAIISEPIVNKGVVRDPAQAAVAPFIRRASSYDRRFLARQTSRSHGAPANENKPTSPPLLLLIKTCVDCMTELMTEVKQHKQSALRKQAPRALADDDGR